MLDARTGKTKHVLPFPDAHAPTATPDGKVLVVRHDSPGGTVLRVLQDPRGVPVWKATEDSAGDMAIAVSPDGKYAALAGYQLQVHDLVTRERLAWTRALPLAAPDDDAPKTLAFLPNGRLVVGSCSWLRLYDPRSGKMLAKADPAPGKKRKPRLCAVAASNAHVAAARADGTVVVYDATLSKVVCEIGGLHNLVPGKSTDERSELADVAFDASGALWISACPNKAVRGPLPLRALRGRRHPPARHQRPVASRPMGPYGRHVTRRVYSGGATRRASGSLRAAASNAAQPRLLLREVVEDRVQERAHFRDAGHHARYHPRMAWKKLGDIHPLYNHVTLVAGDIDVMAGWPGAEAAGYPDDEYELASGTVMVFDLNLVRPTVFSNDGCIRLVASLDGKGTANVDDATLATALDAPGSTKTWGSFEVEHGAMVLTCSDCATPAEGTSTGDPKQPNIPKNVPGEPTLVGKTMLVIPCENGRYDVSQVAKVDAKHGRFDFLLQLTIRKAQGH